MIKVKDSNRRKILDFLQWNDKNGIYTDEECEIAMSDKFSYNDAIKYFFGVLNDDLYYEVADNIFELTYEEVIELAKNNNFYETTIKKINLLENEKNPNSTFYKFILE